MHRFQVQMNQLLSSQMKKAILKINFNLITHTGMHIPLPTTKLATNV